MTDMLRGTVTMDVPVDRHSIQYGDGLPMNTHKPGQLRRDDDSGARESIGAFLASRSVLLSVAAFLGAGALCLAEPAKGSFLAALKPYAPGATSLVGSFLAGLVIGRFARHRLKHVLIAGGVVVAGVALLTKFGVIGPAADQWVQSSVGWVSDEMGKAQSYIAALLPSATAAGYGLFMGFRRKRQLPR